MRIFAREKALDIIGEENCVRTLGNFYVCGLDYLIIKRFVLAEIADDVFVFVGDLPILDVKCERYVMYFGVPKVLFDARFAVEGWRRVESLDSIIVYGCIEDSMEFFEIESFIFNKVPLSMFGFGSIDLYSRLIDLLRAKSLYMLKYFY